MRLRLRLRPGVEKPCGCGCGIYFGVGLATINFSCGLWLRPRLRPGVSRTHISLYQTRCSPYFFQCFNLTNTILYIQIWGLFPKINFFVFQFVCQKQSTSNITYAYVKKILDWSYFSRFYHLRLCGLAQPQPHAAAARFRSRTSGYGLNPYFHTPTKILGGVWISRKVKFEEISDAPQNFGGGLKFWV